MGIDRCIIATLPEPDLRLVASVLNRWRLRNPAQYKLAEFGLQYIQSELRRRVDDLADGFRREIRWICYGCRFDFIYGLVGGRVIFVVTGLADWDHDPCRETIRTVTHIAFLPASETFCRPPGDARRILNHLAVKLAYLVSVPADGLAAASAPSSPLPGDFTASAADFAPPWLPDDYLRAHVPRRGNVRHVLQRRPEVGRTQEFAMKEFTMEKIKFASTLFATRLLHHPQVPRRVVGLIHRPMTVSGTTSFGLTKFLESTIVILDVMAAGAELDIHGDDDIRGTSHSRAFDGWAQPRSAEVQITPHAN